MTQGAPGHEEPSRGVLPLTVLVVTGAAAVFFAGSAAAPDIARAWSLGTSQAASLAWGAQAGFIAGTALAALTNVADRFRPGLVIALLLTGAAACNAALVLVDGDLRTAFALRLAAGALAGPAYPMGMKVLATWYPRLGWQLGIVLGSYTLGAGAAFFLRAAAVAWEPTLVAASVLALVSALAATRLASGPRLPPKSPFQLSAAARAFRVPGYRRSSLAYFGHMWELFAFWALLPFWLDAAGAASAVQRSALVAGVFLAGAAGCVLAGWWSLRAGEARAARLALAVSGACCLASPLLFGATLWLVAPVLLVWGAAVIADSGMYSSLSARAAPRDYVGTALVTQNCIGFAITVISIALVPAATEAGLDWRWALALLAPGPLLGLLPLTALVRADAREQAAQGRTLV